MNKATPIRPEQDEEQIEKLLDQRLRNSVQFMNRLEPFLDQVRAVTDLIWAGSENERCQLDSDTVTNAAFALHMDACKMTARLEKLYTKDELLSRDK